MGGTKVNSIYCLVPVVSLNCVSQLPVIKLLLFRSGGWVGGWPGGWVAGWEEKRTLKLNSAQLS